jgi:hypothetical protein
LARSRETGSSREAVGPLEFDDPERFDVLVVERT